MMAHHHDEYDQFPHAPHKNHTHTYHTTSSWDNSHRPPDSCASFPWALFSIAEYVELTDRRIASVVEKGNDGKYVISLLLNGLEVREQMKEGNINSLNRKALLPRFSIRFWRVLFCLCFLSPFDVAGDVSEAEGKNARLPLPPYSACFAART